MQAYSLDLRLRIVAALDAGKKPSEVADRFAVGVSTVKRYRQQRWETARLDPRPSPGRTPTTRPDQREALWAQLVEHPTAILAEHCALSGRSLAVRHPLSAGASAASSFVVRRYSGLVAVVVFTEDLAAAGQTRLLTNSSEQAATPHATRLRN